MDRFLLDTHTILWYLSADPTLSNKAKNLMEDVENEIYISHVTLWEIVIKISIGKLALPFPFSDFEQKLLDDGFLLSPISSSHLITYSTLPLLHRDPFDRLLIAQSISEEYIIIGKDPAFKDYPIRVIW